MAIHKPRSRKLFSLTPQARKVLTNVCGGMSIPILDPERTPANERVEVVLFGAETSPVQYLEGFLEVQLKNGIDLSRLREIIITSNDFFIALIAFRHIYEPELRRAIYSRERGYDMLQVHGVEVMCPVTSRNGTDSYQKRKLTLTLAHPPKDLFASHIITGYPNIVLCDQSGEPLEPSERFPNLPRLRR